MTDAALINTVTLEQIAEALRKAGYRAQVSTVDGRSVVQSAAQGLGFIITSGNAAATPPNSFADFTFNCLIRVEGELQRAAVEAWNRKKRFGRLYFDRDLLVLALDVLVAGGIAQSSLVAHCELWDRLLHDLIAHLKTARVAVSAKTPAPAEVAPAA